MSKLLDGIINTIFGPDTSAMSDADANQDRESTVN
jgi:hypothetical protein